MTDAHQNEPVSAVPSDEIKKIHINSEISGLTIESKARNEHSLTVMSFVGSKSSSEGTKSENLFENLSQKSDDVVVKKNPLDDLTFEQLAKTVNELKSESKHMTTENYMLERYLTINDPQLLEGMTQMIENAIKMQGTEQVRRATLADTYSTKSYTSANKTESFMIGTSSLIYKGLRITLTQKSDMVMREMEQLQKSLNKFYKDVHKRKCILRAELEEVSIELEETADTANQFEQTVVVEGVDALTQRIPAEKFIRFIQEWLKSSLALIQKYRLRQSTLSVHLRKLKEILKEKKELGESLHAVDFEKLQIENEHFLKEIDSRNLQLIDLKRMNGGANLILTNQKKFLMKQVLQMQKIQKDIDDTRNKTEEMEKETEIAGEQLDKVNFHYENIRQMKEEYQVPEVMDYVKIKGKVYELKKNIKIWSRRSHLQDVALNSSIREMKNITGSKKVLDNWFKINHPQTSTSDLELKIRHTSQDENDISKSSSDLLLDLSNEILL